MAKRKATAGEKWANRVCKSTKAIDWATAVVAYDEAMKLVKRREQSAATHAMLAERRSIADRCEIWRDEATTPEAKNALTAMLDYINSEGAPTKGEVRK